MKKITLILSLLLILLSNLAFAQSEKCAFDKIIQSKQDDPIFQQNRAAYERFVKQFTEQGQLRTTGGTIEIPCVVHIIHTGQAVGTATTTGANPNDAQVISAITDMTDAYKHQGVYDTSAKNGFFDASIDVQFVLAKRTPEGVATSGIIRHDVSSESWGTNFANNGMDAGETPGVPQETITTSRFWPPADYVNIWIVHEIENAMGTLGFASFPQTSPGATDGLTMLASAFGYDPENDDGYLLDPTTNLNGTSNHELGHYFSLYHTFQGDDSGSTCPADLICGTDSDCCADIPPHKQSSGGVCPADGNTNECTSNGPNTYIHNFMDYADDACFHGFSENQKTRMVAALSGPRLSFCGAKGGVAPSGTYPIAATSTSVTATDEFMGIYDVTLNGTTFHSLSSSHDGGYLNRIASQASVSLLHNTSYTISVQVGVGNTFDNELVAVYADFNGDGDFTDSGEQLGSVPGGGGKKNGEVHMITFTTPASGGTAPTGQRIRLRIISDYDNGVDPINSTTLVNNGGQIEDYSILLQTSLPVELTSFTARAVDNKRVHLDWITNSEINSSHFEVQRSKDGQRFATIASVSSTGTGTNTVKQYYSFVDEDPFSGANYYRLQQFDFDGATEFSDLRIVNIRTNLSEGIRIYPNPTKAFIEVDKKESLIISEVIIYNQIGSIVKRTNLMESKIDVSSFPAGIYFFQFISSREHFIERVTVVD